ncbi:MAG: hypothetical protein GY700_06625 [Propionibacteriaceae bacterium]|nr:hypothetical protein [Propionibacteriaceae bacterium]
MIENTEEIETEEETRKRGQDPEALEYGRIAKRMSELEPDAAARIALMIALRYAAPLLKLTFGDPVLPAGDA